MAGAKFAIVVRKAAIFHRGLTGRRADNKWTLLDFSLSLLYGKRKQKSRE